MMYAGANNQFQSNPDNKLLQVSTEWQFIKYLLGRTKYFILSLFIICYIINYNLYVHYPKLTALGTLSLFASVGIYYLTIRILYTKIKVRLFIENVKQQPELVQIFKNTSKLCFVHIVYFSNQEKLVLNYSSEFYDLCEILNTYPWFQIFKNDSKNLALAIEIFYQKLTGLYN